VVAASSVVNVARVARDRRRAALAAVGIIVVLGAGALLLGLLGDEPGDDAVACGPEPTPELIPEGSGAEVFTMGLRVNKTQDVDEFAASGVANRIADRDVFVVNTEYDGSDTREWEQIVDRLEESFPCNRIAALNGLDTTEDKPGYMLALAGHPGVDAVLLDWEPDTWEGAGRGAWEPGLKENLARISARLAELGDALESNETRMGLVPEYLPPWDYGQTARVIALENWKLNPLHRGYQLVQTQPNCGDPGAPGPLIGRLARQLLAQYKPLFAYEPAPGGWQRASEPSDVLLRHLGFEIAFSESPNPSASEAVDRIGPAQAASCSTEVLREGGGAILYWADPSAIEAMLETSAGSRLRPGR
jgi:hypothetical protein